MAVYTVVSIHLFCDECHAMYGDDNPPENVTQRAARRLASEDGWTSGKRDLCPDCNGQTGPGQV